MKNLMLLLCCLVAVFFVQCGTLKHKNIDYMYEVYKIDSIKSFYLIYAKRDTLNYKIVSKKGEKGNKCTDIRLNHLYAFKLHSMSTINGKSITPAASTYEVSGMWVDDLTTVAFERETQWDLFSAENIKGLCFVRN